MDSFFLGKKILVTGSCGTIGKELVKQLLIEKKHRPSKVVGIDINESEIFFQDQKYLSDDRADFFVSDVCDLNSLSQIMSEIEIVFHCAALKHVIICERSPQQAIKTNIIGVQNVITAAQINKVGRVLFTSSDKAVNPTNVMGTTKLMGERMMTAAHSNGIANNPIFASTRFGNVLGSNGSVTKIFNQQIRQGGPLTLTDKRMTRFVMSVEEAVKLVINTVKHAQGGEVFVTKMPVVRVEDLATAMIEEISEQLNIEDQKIQVAEIGVKPGEKLYEELMSEEETTRSIELDDYYIILPAFREIYSDIKYTYQSGKKSGVKDPYTSSAQKALGVKNIRELLKRYNLLDVKS